MSSGELPQAGRCNISPVGSRRSCVGDQARCDLHGMTRIAEGTSVAIMDGRLVALHGWMDVGASFQFLVDALVDDWHVVAPDLRGFGRSEWQPQGYWFADYIADLDALLDQVSPDAPVRLLGHSLGGNIVMHYAGSRPARVHAVVSLEGFGIPFELASAAPENSSGWRTTSGCGTIRCSGSRCSTRCSTRSSPAS